MPADSHADSAAPRGRPSLLRFWRSYRLWRRVLPPGRAIRAAWYAGGA